MLPLPHPKLRWPCRGSRPDRVSAQCGACVVALLVLKLGLGTYVARLAIIRIAPETRSAEDLIRGSYDQ